MAVDMPTARRGADKGRAALLGPTQYAGEPIPFVHLCTI